MVKRRLALRVEEENPKIDISSSVTNKLCVNTAQISQKTIILHANDDIIQDCI